MMKARIVNGIVSLAILAQSFTAGATAHPLFPPGTPEDRQAFFEGIDRMAAKSSSYVAFADFKPQEIRRRIVEGGKTVALTPLKSMPHMAQTLTLLWILGGVEAVRQSHKMSPFQAKPLSNTELALQVGDHLINSFDLFSAMIGGSTTSVAMKMPLDAFNQLVSSNVTRPMLRQLLISGAGSFVTFVGWESGAKLWEQSMLQLDASDIPIAKDLRFLDMLSGRGTTEQRRVFGHLMSKAYGILTFADPETTSLWLYNTWRHRIGTGEFVTLVTSMVVAGTLAGSLAPGAGNVVGFCFGMVGGLVGGFAAMWLPHSMKQPITDGIRRARMNSSQKSLARMGYGMRLILTASGWSPEILAKHVKFSMEQRSAYRDRILSAEFEQIYDAFLRRQEAESLLQMLMIHNPILQSSADEMMTLREESQAQLLEANERLRFYLNEALNIYRKEATELGNLAYADSTAPEVRDALLAEVGIQSELFQMLRHVYGGILTEDILSLEIDAPTENDRIKLQISAQIFLNLVYMRGYSEAEFLPRR